MRLIHLTDPHLSTLEGTSFTQLSGKRWSGYLSWRRKRRFQHQKAMLERVVQAIHEEDPDFIVVTGDLAHIGLPSESQQIRDWLHTLGAPEKVLVIPGNHDIYQRDSWQVVREAWAPYLHLPEQDEALLSRDNRQLYPLRHEVGDMTLIATSSATPTPIFSATGELGESQLARLDTLLGDEAPDRFCCVLVHHPPLPGMIGRRKALDDATSLRAVLTNRPVDLVLHGHDHRNSSSQLGDTRIYSTNSASSVVEGRQAAYRVFDVVSTAAGWSVAMQLKQLASADADASIVQSDSWHIAPRGSA